MKEVGNSVSKSAVTAAHSERCPEFLLQSGSAEAQPGVEVGFFAALGLYTALEVFLSLIHLNYARMQERERRPTVA